jgi:hypothetical protein
MAWTKEGAFQSGWVLDQNQITLTVDGLAIRRVISVIPAITDTYNHLFDLVESFPRPVASRHSMARNCVIKVSRRSTARVLH